MPFKFEFDAGTVTEWTATADGATASTVHDYTPSIYVDARDGHLDTLEAALADDPKVASQQYERWYTALDAAEQSRVLRVDLHRMSEVRFLAREIRLHHERGNFAPGTFRLYNADFSPQFRYCMETGTSPVPEADLDLFRLAIEDQHLAQRDVTELSVDGQPVQGDEDAVLRTVQHRLNVADLDVLLMSHGDLVPLLFEKANAHQVADFQFGRRPGFEQLAGANTFESYGRVGHSPARYDVPGGYCSTNRTASFGASPTSRGCLTSSSAPGNPFRRLVGPASVTSSPPSRSAKPSPATSSRR